MLSTYKHTCAQIIGLKCHFTGLSKYILSCRHLPQHPSHYRENIQAVALSIEALGVGDGVGWGGGWGGVGWGQNLHLW